MINKLFLSHLLALGLPILLQNLFVVLGSTLTTLMAGQLGDIPLAAIGLANQLFFILALVQFGLSSGSAIFTAQYWGNHNKENISKVLGVALLTGLVTGTLFMLVAVLIPQTFLHLFTSDEQVIVLGTQLLRILGPSFLFTPIVNIYSFILRSTGNVRLPMFVSISGVLLNIFFGLVLIFGYLGFPALGAFGAAYANLIARVLECLLLVWIIYRLKTPLALSLRQMLSFDTAFSKKTLGRVLPVMLNELLWALGISVYNAIYARISTESIAAISIKDSIESLLFVPILGITHACAIMVGNAIGSGEQEKSHDFVKQSLRVATLVAVVLGGGLILGRNWIASLYNISDLTHFYTRNLLLILGAVLWLRGLNLVFFIGMMRSGGDTRFAYWMDVGLIWFFGVPLALLAVTVFKLPVHQVYMLVMLEEAVKFGISLWRYRSRRWIHNLVAA